MTAQPPPSSLTALAARRRAVQVRVHKEAVPGAGPTVAAARSPLTALVAGVLAFL